MSLVEYYDPDDVYTSLSPQLQAHLPLRNLNWKSPSRPLKSINSLHVDFVPSPDNPKRASASSESSRSEQNGSAQEPARVRRHQIPGLRATPYLKIYLLRCDDKDAYKSSARAKIREWLDKNRLDLQTSTKTSKTEDHDAAEWLIVHVIYPNTAAAEQAQGKKLSGVDHEMQKEKQSGNLRWKRGSNNVLDKLRNDFNHSKSSLDHVAQVRLQDTSSEKQKDWSDLVTNLKTLILASLSSRVAQYEYDVREKEAQRSLPGWNFCTFFILKEGLARAFESVGLLEDALASYDELTSSLDDHVHDQASAQREQQKGSFPAYAEDLEALLACFIPRNAETDSENQSTSSILRRPFDSTRKAYRDLIVSNSISFFDFKCYIVSRQMELLLARTKSEYIQQGNNDDGQSSKESNGSLSADQRGNPSLYTEVCQLALQKVAPLARILSQELRASAEASKNNDVTDDAIDTLVAAWSFAASDQVLQMTNSSLLPKPPSEQGALLKSNASARSTSSKSKRKSQLNAAQISQQGLTVTPLDADEEPENRESRQPLNQQMPGLSDLAAYRADLLLLQRRMIDRLATINGWQILKSSSNTPSTASSSDDPDEEEEESISHQIKGLEALAQFNFLVSLQGCRMMYQTLTDQMAWLYHFSDRKHSSRKMSGDLAMLKFAMRDYAAAASLINRMASNSEEESWTTMETSLLNTYATCLKMLNRRDDHVRILLTLLSIELQKQKSLGPRSRMAQHSLSSTPPVTGSTHIKKFTENIFNDVKKSAQQLPYELNVSLTDYFDVIQPDSHITLFPNKDGFQLGLTVKQQLAESLKINGITIHLVGVGHSDETEITVQRDAPLQIGNERERLLLNSSTTTLGSFIVDKIVIRIEKIVFVHEPLKKAESSTPLQLTTSTSGASVNNVKDSPILIYPRANSLQADILPSSETYLGKETSIQVNLHAGLNSIGRTLLRIRSASSDIQLQTSKAVPVAGISAVNQSEQTEVIEIESIQQKVVAKLLVPFIKERNRSLVTFRIEIRYETDHGLFTFFKTCNVNFRLQMDVNVQEIFKTDYAFVKFLLSPAGKAPIQVLDAELQGQKNMNVAPIVNNFSPLIIYGGNPASVAYRLSKSEDQILDSRPLLLNITYLTFEALVEAAIKGLVSKEIEDSTLHRFENLLWNKLEVDVITKISKQAYEDAANTANLNLPWLKDLDWTAVLSATPKEDHNELVALIDRLRKYDSVRIMNVISEDSSKPYYDPQKLIIEFEIPPVHYLHTAMLEPAYSDNQADTEKIVYIVGQPIEVKLKISFTMRWAVQDFEDRKPRQHGFSYSLQLRDTWLTSGLQRATFSCIEDEVVSFDLTLIPLKTGLLFLPFVDVQNTPDLTDGHESDDEVKSIRLSLCQTDCISRFQSVMVIDGMKSTTMGIGTEEDLTQGMSLISSEDRGKD